MRIVSRREGVCDLQFDDHDTFNDEIRDEFSDETFFIVNRVFRLLCERNPSITQFDTKGVLVEFFIHSRTQRFLNSNRSSDDLPCEFSMRIFVGFFRYSHL